MVERGSNGCGLKEVSKVVVLLVTRMVVEAVVIVVVMVVGVFDVVSIFSSSFGPGSQ